MGIRHGWHFHKASYPVRVRRGVIAIVGMGFVITVHTFAQNAKNKDASPGPEFRNAAPGVRYVGSNMCRGCHSAIYQHYSRTDLAHCTSLPGSILDMGWLNKPADIYNKKLNRHYQVFARDSKVYQSEYGLDSQRNETFRHTEELAYVVGTDHRIRCTPDEPFPESAFKGSLRGAGFIHVNAVPGQDSKVPPQALLRAFRQELNRSHLEYKDYYFSLLDQLSKSNNKDPFVLSAMAQKASSDGDLDKAIAYAGQVINPGSTSTYDYLLLDGLLARSGNLTARIDTLKAPPLREPGSPPTFKRKYRGGGLQTIRRGLELFREDPALRDVKNKAKARGLVES